MSPEDAVAPEPARRAVPPPQQVTDVRALRALTHPVRIALIEALSMSGAMTATEVGERIGESPTTCSFHLRQLAKYGFVEEAGGGKGRARPWRMTSVGMSFASTHEDPEAELASGAALRMIRERELDRYRTWLETRTSYPPRWREAAGDSEYIYYVTAEELAQLNQELSAMLQGRFFDRLTDPSLRPAGSVPVEVLTLSFPIALPEPGAGGGQPAGPGGQPTGHGDQPAGHVGQPVGHRDRATGHTGQAVGPGGRSAGHQDGPGTDEGSA
jgi:DNA-binding transcriptional ArsR family regulator